MIKLFKNVDERLADIGFKKIEENKHLCEYDKENREFGYVQKVIISYKESGQNTLQSYDVPNLFNNEGIGNTCVGLTGYEMNLFLKKMKKMGLYSKGENK